MLFVTSKIVLYTIVPEIQQLDKNGRIRKPMEIGLKGAVET